MIRDSKCGFYSQASQVCRSQRPSSNLATSILTTLVDLLLEVYATIRIFVTIRPPRFQSSATDVWIWRGLTLVLLDLLVMVPNAIATNTLAAFIPFSIGALCVLGEYIFSQLSLLRGYDVVDTLSYHQPLSIMLNRYLPHPNDFPSLFDLCSLPVSLRPLNPNTHSTITPSNLYSRSRYLRFEAQG